MILIRSNLNNKLERQLSKLFVTLFFIFLFTASHAKDLQPSELDVSIGELSLPEYIRLAASSQALSNQNNIHIQQQGDRNQLTLNLNLSANSVEIFQNGNSNISDISINGSENSVSVNQIGESNYVELNQVSNNSFTSVEQIGSYNIVIMDLKGNSQVNRVSQYGNSMKAIIRN